MLSLQREEGTTPSITFSSAHGVVLTDFPPKLKCDETRPQCLRCSKRNESCPGYAATKTASLDTSSLPEEDSNSADDQAPTTSDHVFADATQLSSSYMEADDFSMNFFQFDCPESDAEGTFGSENTPKDYWRAMDTLDHDQKPQRLHRHHMVNLDSTSRISPTPWGQGSLIHRPTFQFGSYHGGTSESSRLSNLKPCSDSASQQRPDNEALSLSLAKPVITDLSSMLVEYYFKEVAGLFSCYDSQLNPFRSTVSQLWKSSTPVFYAVQSMAAACLTDVFPSLHATGLKMRDRAAACVEASIRNSQVDTGSLLTLIMLGLSASWHHPNDLGRKEFDHARTIMDAIHAGKVSIIQESTNSRNLQFFQEAMIYWEMLLSHVSDIDMPIQPLASKTPASQSDDNDMPKPSYPHPWTGVAREAQTIVVEVGRLVRQERLRMMNRPSFTSLADLDTGQKAFQTATVLAHNLVNLKFPTEEAIVSPRDAQTPVKHLLTIAEAYRLAGLLQLYRVFPDLLEIHQMRNMDLSWDSDSQTSQNLTKMALEISTLLQTIPIESRTRCVQPFLLVAVASELRSGQPSIGSKGSDHVSEASDDLSTPIADIEVLEARKFVIGRFSTFEHVLPAKPIRQMVEIIKHTWHRIDMGWADVYWMDVMIEKGWETTMG